MSAPGTRLLVVAILALPVALAVGGHNGATAVGVAAVLLSIFLNIFSPSRKDPS